MPELSELDARERRIFDACQGAWFMSGRYRALFDEHSRNFEADSVAMLYRQVANWYNAHKTNHKDAHLLVKCIAAL